MWSVGIRSDGRSLVAVGAEGMARGLDPESGGEFTLDVRGPGRFAVLAVAPHNTGMVTGGPGRTFHTWTFDRATPPTRTLGPAGGRRASVRALAASGRRIATVATDGTLEIWDWSGNHLAQNVQPGDQHTCVAFSPDGMWLAVGSHRRVRLMSEDLTRVQDRGPTGGAPVNAIAIARDGSWIVSAEANGDLQIRDETPPHHTSGISAHKGPATAVAVSPDSRWLASGGEDGTVAVWDRRTRECRTRYSAHTGPVHAVAITPDGTRVISTGEDGAVRVWDSRGPERIRSGDGDGMWAVTVVGDAELLAVAHRDGSTRLCDPYGDTRSSPLSSRHGEYRGPVAFAPHGSWYAAGHLHSVEIKTIDQSAVTDPAVLPLGPSTTAQALAVSPDGRWLAIADSAGALQLWNRLPEARTATVPGQWGAGSRAHAITVAPDGTWLAVLRHRYRSGRTGTESLVQVVRLTEGCVVADHQIHIHRGEKLTGLAVTPDGSRLLTTSLTGDVSQWDPRTGALRTTVTDPDGPVNALAVSPDGKWIATAGPLLRVWDIVTGRTAAGVRAEGPLTSCAWLPDGHGLVAVGERGLYLHEFRP
ncbi:hypothetical protein ABZ371_09100 [Streptomyces sp. NPDC005899]|uniref:WD40 repeat domain-containing protein n=1 Tax=Streptomyces sp. NPDC005899 TaxID=3155716 RepID=UPI0033DD8315